MTAKPSLLILLAASAVLLAGCASPATTNSSGNDNDSSDSSDDSAGVDALGTPCEDNTSGLELFSDPAISQSPEYGQVWGDGSPLVITYDDYSGGTLGYDLSYVQDDGAAIALSGGFFPDPEGTTFTSSDLSFDSASDGYYAIATISVTTEDLVTTPLGAYCLVLKKTD